MGPYQPLFCQHFEWQKLPIALQKLIEDLPDSVFVTDDKEALAELMRAHRLEVPQLNLPGEHEQHGDVIVRSIPFTGSAALFEVMSSAPTSGFLEGLVAGDRLFVTAGRVPEGMGLDEFFAVQDRVIEDWLVQITLDVADHHAHVDRTACDLFEERRSRLSLLPGAPTVAE